MGSHTAAHGSPCESQCVDDAKGKKEKKIELVSYVSLKVSEEEDKDLIKKTHGHSEGHQAREDVAGGADSPMTDSVNSNGRAQRTPQAEPHRQVCVVANDVGHQHRQKFREMITKIVKNENKTGIYSNK